MYKYNNINFKDMINPFKNDKNYIYIAYEVFLALKDDREIDNVKINFNSESLSIELKFDKENAICANEIFAYYATCNQDVSINETAFKFDLQDVEKNLLFIIKYLKSVNNTFKIVLNEKDFEYLENFIIYKQTSYYDDDYFLREQLDKCVF